MQNIYAIGPAELKLQDTALIRKNFLLENLMTPDSATFVYTHYDRMVVGGIMPLGKKIPLTTHDELKAGYFLERREIGIINVGGNGTIEINGKSYSMAKLDCLYIGKGTKDIVFSTIDQKDLAVYFALSCPAHRECETKKLTRNDALPVQLGTVATSNERTIYKYIHKDGIQSCQLVMGLTVLKEGSVWNTMPPHTHDRRMEAYFYFDIGSENRIFHLMGQPQETRHLLVANHQAVISPPWSIHAGCGTSNYSFIWGMAGENLDFTDMDGVTIPNLR